MRPRVDPMVKKEVPPHAVEGSEGWMGAHQLGMVALLIVVV